LRDDYDRFIEAGAEVLVIGPDGPNAFRRYWMEQDMPFPGMADKKSRVADLYAQEFNLLKLGRMPAVFIIDLNGIIRYHHYGESMDDIPTTDELLAMVESFMQKA
jgi:peroxiredoxin